MYFNSVGLCVPLDVLIAQRVELVLVKGSVPRPLNEPAARRVVVRRRQREAGAAADAIHRLHECFAERGLADEHPAIVILQCARHDFRCAGAVAVGNHDNRQVDELAVFGRPIILVRVRDAAARVDDHLALRQELVGHLDRLVERTAGVAADVEHETTHPLGRQIPKRPLEIAVGVLAEILQLDVAGGRIEHEVGGDRGNVDFVARHFERNQLIVAAAPERDVDRRPLRTAQLLHRLFGGPALGVLVADARERVAASYAFLVGRRAFEHARRDDVAVGGALNLDAEAVVAAFLTLAHLRVGFRIEEARMRIQRAEHAANRAVDEAVGFDSPDVVRLNRVERDGERLVIGSLVVDGQCAPAEEPADESGNDDGKDNGWNGTVTSHGC